MNEDGSDDCERASADVRVTPLKFKASEAGKIQMGN
jgi:hypothetical protein